MENKDAVQLYLSSVKTVLEKLGEFLTEKTTWSTKYRRRGRIYLEKLNSRMKKSHRKEKLTAISWTKYMKRTWTLKYLWRIFFISETSWRSWRSSIQRLAASKSEDTCCLEKYHEQLARNTFDGSDAEDQINTRSLHTRESNPVDLPGQQN